MGHEGTHFEGFLIPRCAAIVTAFEAGWPKAAALDRQFAFPVDGDHVVNQLSPNQWKMGIAVEYARAAAWGTSADLIVARLAIDSWLDRELVTQGLWLQEQFCGGAHSGMHIQADGIALMGSIKAGDGERGDRIFRAIQNTLNAALTASTPSGAVVCVGQRQQTPLELGQYSAALRVAMGLPQRGKLAKSEAEWHDDFQVGPRAYRALKLAGHLPTTRLGLGPMRIPLTIVRGDGTHYAEDGAGRWCQVDWRVNDRDPKNALGVTFGPPGVKPKALPAGAIFRSQLPRALGAAE